MYLNSINKSHRSIICGDINIDILNQNISITTTVYLNYPSIQEYPSLFVHSSGGVII